MKKYFIIAISLLVIIACSKPGVKAEENDTENMAFIVRKVNKDFYIIREYGGTSSDDIVCDGFNEVVTELNWLFKVNLDPPKTGALEEIFNNSVFYPYALGYPDYSGIRSCMFFD